MDVVRRSARVRFAAVLIASSISSLLIEPAFAVNEFAGYRKITGGYTGIQGTQHIRTDPATHAGEGYVHPVQIGRYDTPGSNFVAIGTANGLGVDNCPSQYNPDWDVYYDGQIGGVYFCVTAAVNKYSAGASPGFKILRTACNPSTTDLRWALTMGGSTYACLASAWGQGEVAQGLLEHVGSDGTDRNIDVKYTNVQVRQSAWADFGTGYKTEDPNYTAAHVSNTAFNAYLGTLD